jgi:predicted GNAT family N-acyltransferase
MEMPVPENMTYSIIQTNWQTHRESLRHIRNVVFIHEQQVPIDDEWDDKDETAIHFLVTNTQGNAIGCARLLIEGNLLHIGRVAILGEYREHGIGRQLMQFVLVLCAQQYPDFKIYLHAQTSRIAFYEHLGFIAQGDVFMDAGIPHIEMWHQTNAV